MIKKSPGALNCMSFRCLQGFPGSGAFSMALRQCNRIAIDLKYKKESS